MLPDKRLTEMTLEELRVYHRRRQVERFLEKWCFPLYLRIYCRPGPGKIITRERWREMKAEGKAHYRRACAYEREDAINWLKERLGWRKRYVPKP